MPGQDSLALGTMQMVGAGYAEEARTAAVPSLLPLPGFGHNDVPAPSFHAWNRFDRVRGFALEKQAAKAGGYVHPLIGNHEAMNLYGDLRYTTPGEFAAFKTGESEQVRAAFWEQQVKALPNPPDDAARQKWETEHPLGWFDARHSVRTQRNLRQVDPLPQRGHQDQRRHLPSWRNQPALRRRLAQADR